MGRWGGVSCHINLSYISNTLMTGRRLQENYHFCVQAYLQEKGIQYFNKYVLQHKNEIFSINDWFYTDVNKPTTLDLIKMLNNEKILK